MDYIKWETGSFDASVARTLSDELGISSLAARVLCSRGIGDVAAARAFLDTKLTSLHDPMLLKDMQQAVERIEQALECDERIAIYGDYDVDGITATYILYDYLQSLGADCVYYIPDRIEEGYGVNLNAVRYLAEQGITLVITVDTGVTAVSEVEEAKKLGVDFVITDHHECQDQIPDACAVINPHRADCEYPFKNLAGVGVAFKLICALEEGVAEQYLPFVCTGTIADIMPLTGENRIIAVHGMQGFTECQNPGLRALIKAAGAEDKAVNSDTVGFQLAPRINAAGRMSSASRVVELFCINSRDEADALADELCKLNTHRRSIELEIFEQAVKQVEENEKLRNSAVLVISGEGWHHGVLGIVASRICEKYRKPAILISVDNGEGKGSGRSVKGVNLFNGLVASSEHLEKFGGHEQAAGISVKCDKIDDFRRAINSALAQEVQAYTPSVQVDFCVEPGELTLDEIRSLRVLEPYGTGNPKPILQLNGMCAADVGEIGGGKHLRLQLERSGKFPCVFFGRTMRDLAFSKGAQVDAVFVPEINDFRGENVQLLLRDIRPSGNIKTDGEIYAEFLQSGVIPPDRLSALKVEYNDLAAVWIYLKKTQNTPRVDGQVLCKNINAAFKRCLTALKLKIALDILSELGIISYTGDEIFDIKISDINGKADLSKSPIAVKVGCVPPTRA